MPVGYDWSPAFGALNNLIQQQVQKKQYEQALSGMFGQGQMADNPVAVTPAANAQGADQARAMAQVHNAQPLMTGGGPLAGQSDRMLPMLQALGPQMGVPLLMKTALNSMQAPEYDPTPRYDQQGNAFLTGKDGSIHYLNGVRQQTKVDVSNGQAYDPYNTQPGTMVGEKKPLINGGLQSNDNGKTWQAIPGYVKQQSAIASAKGNDEVGWQLLVDPKTNSPYRYNVRTGQALDFGGNPYTPAGASHVASGQVRSPASLAVQKFVQENPNATANDIAQFSADFGSTGKAVSAFGAGKQGDLIRSFNVGISHLGTLGGLVDALGNGDVQAINKLGNAWAKQTGSQAPTNFDAAKAIVGDEIIKAIVGGGGALADRENAQNQIDRANSPQQLRGVIQTYKTLMAGQLEGLKKQYTDTTHRDNFDSRLSADASAQLEHNNAAPSSQAAPQAPTQSRSLNGKNYHLVNGQWMQE